MGKGVVGAQVEFQRKEVGSNHRPIKSQEEVGLLPPPRQSDNKKTPEMNISTLIKQTATIRH